MISAAGIIVIKTPCLVVMPHNLFLHSEIIQSRKWNLKEEAVIQRQLKFEFKDTLFSMIIGWAINSAMILMAAATFYQRGENQVDDLTTAGNMLTPLLGNEATVIFAIALLLAGLSSSITAGMAGGTIFSGIFNKPYDIATKEIKFEVISESVECLGEYSCKCRACFGENFL